MTDVLSMPLGRLVLVLMLGCCTTAFVPVTIPVDVNTHNWPTGSDLRTPNIIAIGCDELKEREIKQEELSTLLQRLNHQRLAAQEQNDANLVNDLSTQIEQAQFDQTKNLMVMQTVASVPVYSRFQLRPTSDLVLFLLGQTDLNGGEIFPRWTEGEISYLRYSSNFPTLIEWRTDQWDHENEHYLTGGDPALVRDARVAKMDAPVAVARWHDSIDPFASEWAGAFGAQPVDVAAPVHIEPDSSLADCQGYDCRGLRFGEGRFELTTEQICDAWNSKRGALLELEVSYDVLPTEVRVTYAVGFKATTRRPTTGLELEALQRAVDDILRDFISDVLGPAQIFTVSDDPIAEVVPTRLALVADPVMISRLRTQLIEFHRSVVDELGRELTINEVDSLFVKERVDRYRELGDGEIAFVFKLNDKEATLSFRRSADGLELFEIRSLAVTEAVQ